MEEWTIYSPQDRNEIVKRKTRGGENNLYSETIETLEKIFLQLAEKTEK